MYTVYTIIKTQVWYLFLKPIKGNFLNYSQTKNENKIKILLYNFIIYMKSKLWGTYTFIKILLQMLYIFLF